MKKFCFLFLAMFSVAVLSAQTSSISGTVVDEKGQPLVGATVFVPGTTIGVVTDANGNFVLKAPSAKQVQITFIGYKDVVEDLSGKSGKLGQVVLTQDAVAMEDILVTQSVAITRKTPVAVSTVSSDFIAEKIGTMELPEILKSTPGVFAHKQGGGYGDSEIRMRGFEQANVAVMINGVPINDMEWGGTYWSNWQGLTEVTRSMQTQRGLGASKISAPSVGGSINIITKSLDAEKGGSISYSLASDNYYKFSFNVSSGMNEKGWAFTLLGTSWKGDGYNQGTEGSGYNYFVNVAKRLGNNHQLSFTAFGAPQKHYQRGSYDALTVQNWAMVQNYMGNDSKYKYNATYGYGKNGERKTSAYNEYHKPLFSLNHQWQINPQSSLSTAVYASFGRGNGYSGQGRDGYSNSSWYGSSNGTLNTTFRNADGTFAYDQIEEMNELSTNGSKMIMSKSVNDHQWYGLLSTYTNHLTDYLELSGGVDARYYIGTHTNEIIDLYGGKYYMDDSSRGNVKAVNNAAAADPNFKYQKLQVGDVVYRDYDGHIAQGGLFAQLEYSKEALTAFVSGSVSNNTYWRYDRFYYDAAHAESEKVNKWGYTVKGGANYNISERSNVFANVGYISRTPFFSGGIFLQGTTSNIVNPNPANEKVMSFELGYGFRTPYLTVNVNGYYTNWMDKTMARSSSNQTWVINMTGVDALHKGVELDFTAKPTQWLDVTGMFSYGDWKWNSNATGFFYDMQGQPLKTIDDRDAAAQEIASGVGAEDHLSSTINIKDIKVGGSPQTTAALGLTFKPMKGVRVGLDWNYYGRQYSYYNFSSSQIAATGGVTNIADPWEVPAGNEFDLFANYNFKLGDFNATLSGNVNNLLDQHYISFSRDGGNGLANSAYVYYAQGRTFSIRLKVNF